MCKGREANMKREWRYVHMFICPYVEGKQKTDVVKNFVVLKEVKIYP